MDEARSTPPGDAVAVFRDRTHLTRLLVLRELHVHKRRTLREIADALGVSVQAVSTYAKGLAVDGLLAERGGRYQPTPKGLQVLQEGFARLRRVVDDALAPLTVIEATSAIAREPVRAGDEVGLFMEDGHLVAWKRESGSRGRALADADVDGEVVVGDLTGVVALEPGRLLVLQVPGPLEGGSARVHADAVTTAIKARGFRDPRVAAEGTGALVLATRAGLRVDFSFASVDAAFNAAERGLDVVLLVTRDLVRDAFAVIDERNARTLKTVPVDVVDLPLTGAAPALAERAPPGRRRAR